MRVGLLTEEQMERVHRTSLRILEEIGVRLPHRETLERFEARGACVDFASERVRIPPDLVMSLLDVAGKRFSIFGWDAEKRASFGSGSRNYNSIAGEASWLETPRGKRRYARLADVADAARVGDALPNITIVGAMADPEDVPIARRCVEVAATTLQNTEKPITFWFYDRASAAYLV